MFVYSADLPLHRHRVLATIVTYNFLAHFSSFALHVGSEAMEVPTITTSFLYVCAKDRVQ